MVETVMEDDEEFVDEARMEATNGQNIFPFTQYFQPRESEFNQSFTESPGLDRPPREIKPFPGIKKDRKKNGVKVDMPPTPWGCEWRRTDDGWQLWRCWTERDESTGEKIKKSRYTGCLSLDAWQVMKGYDYETFISTLGQRFRRYGKR